MPPAFPILRRLPRLLSPNGTGFFHFAALWKRVAVVAAGPAANFLLAIVVFAAVFTLIGRPHILPIADTVCRERRRACRDQAGRPHPERRRQHDRVLLRAAEHVMLSAGETAIDRRRSQRRRAHFVGRCRSARSSPTGWAEPRTSACSASPPAPSTSSATIRRRPRPGRARDRPHHRPHACLCRQAADREGKRRAAVGADPHRAGVRRGRLLGGIPGLIYLTAVLSVSIGLFNLFPVPMLDGGHLFFYLIEAVRGRPSARACRTSASASALRW